MNDADILIVNGAVLTLDDEAPRARSLALRDRHIVAVGDDLDDWRGPRTEVIDARGGTVMPGIIDSHNHVRLSANPNAVLLADATSLDEIRRRLAAKVAQTPGGDWIEGEGWNYSVLPGGRPDAALIDDVTGDRPAWLFSYDVHTVWLNSAAIRRLGISAASPTLPYGTAEVADGRLTGWIHDFATRGIHPRGEAYLETVVPGYHPEAQYRQLVTNLRDAVRLGITTIVEPQNSLRDLALFERAHREGELASRLVAALLHTPDGEADPLEDIARAISTYRHDRISLGPVKLYIDDVIESHHAAMLKPYANAPGAGGLFWPADRFAELIVTLEDIGAQAFVHATGDLGIRTALDAFEEARRRHGLRDTRHQIVHVECLDGSDVARFAQLGVVACMQPRHCAPDVTGEWRESVGPARQRYAWAMHSLMESGACVAFSSDWNVAEMDPMVGVYTAMTRADLAGHDAWNVQETVTLDQALRAYCRGGAWANFVDAERGTLSVGKQGDVIVLDQDLTTLAPLRILETRVAHTLVDGVIAYAAG